MNLLQAHQKLATLAPFFFTKDAAITLGITPKYASIILSRLAKQNSIVNLSRGRWAYTAAINPLLLPNILAFPMKAYVSLYSALYFRGLISQMPSTVYAITNGKTKLFRTRIETVSLHSISGKLFTGYELLENTILMATAEKALFDTLYLFPAKSHFFRRLTELEIPRNFNIALIYKWIKMIGNVSRRSMMETQLAAL